MYFGAAMRQAPELSPAVQAVKHALERADYDEAAAHLPRLEDAVASAELSGTAARAAKRGVRELRNGLTGQPYWRQEAWKRVAISFAGPAVNLALALVLLTTLSVVASGGYRLGIAYHATSDNVTNVVETVESDSPAARVGLRPGDRIVGVNGRKLSREDIRTVIAGSHGRPLTVMVQRDGTPLKLGPVAPRAVPKLSVPDAAWMSVRLSGEVIRGTAVGLVHLFSGRDRHELAGPVGVVQVSSTAASEGAEQYLWILGLISLSLGAFNLLPILPLDGGHILLSTIEGIRRRALGRVVYERFAALGIALVLVLAFIILSSDLSRLGGG
jgi:regulator of sigma E protease